MFSELIKCVGPCARSFYHSGCFQQSVEYFTDLLSQPPQYSPSYERFVMQAMIFLHNVRMCKAYRGKPENTVSSGLGAEEQVEPFLFSCFLTQSIFDTNIYHYVHRMHRAKMLIKPLHPLGQGTSKSASLWFYTRKQSSMA